MEWNPDTITSVRFRQLCDLNVPYTGYVDDGYGTVMFIDKMKLNDNTFETGDIMNYEKSVLINVSEVIHTVKKGDNISIIAEKLGVTVDQIIRDNGIKTPDLIYPGNVLNIKTDIQYGYYVRSEVDLPSFQSGEEGCKPLSETVIYEGLDYVSSVADEMASSLEKNAGRSTIGNNGKFYWERPSGRAFHGNQFVNTRSLSNIGRMAGKSLLPLAIALETTELRDCYYQDNRTFGHNMQKKVVCIAGAFAGAALGAKVGAAIGVWFGGVGSIPGAIIGGFIGGLIGGFLGGTGAEAGYEALSKIEIGQSTIK